MSSPDAAGDASQPPDSSSGSPESSTPESSTPEASPSEGGSEGGGGAQIGDPCTSDSQCPGTGAQLGTCMTMWPGGGFCTIVGCSGLCPGTHTWCANYQSQTYCAPSCQPGITDCTRPGYACTNGGCLPAGDGG
jgi:hypothetical protein